MFDAAVIGTGPAGLSAAITLKMRGKSVLWFGSKELSLKVERAETVANYPGLGLIGGRELNERFRAHAKELELEPVERTVTLVSKRSDRYVLLADNEMYEAKTLLLATGAASAKGFAGEDALLGRGVSYCATCDGMFYRGKTIAVYCGAARYLHEVEYLAELAAKVYLFPGAPDCVLELPNVELRKEKIKSVNGGLRASELALSDGSTLPIDGLFCLRSAIAPAKLVPGLELDGVHIAVDRSMATNFPGCFAAGDCTGLPYQIAKAVGEGNLAAHSMLEYLAKEADLP